MSPGKKPLEATVAVWQQGKALITSSGATRAILGQRVNRLNKNVCSVAETQ